MTRRARARNVCPQPTLAGRTCRRAGCWCLAHDTSAYCWQHATDLARDRGEPEVIHWITGERRPVKPRDVATDTRPLPIGVDAVVRELNRVRTRRALARARMAVICDLPHCADVGGLRPEISNALAAAKHRVGVPIRTGVPQ